MRIHTLLGVLLSGLLLAGGVQASPVTKTVVAQGDTSMARNNPNLNRGNEPELELRATGHERILVRMDPQAVREAVGSGRLVSARLELELVATQGLGSATTLAVHPLVRAWNEGDGKTSGATWNCANDTNLANNKIDCTDANQWDMDAGVATWGPVAASATLVANQTGVVGWDVTAAVAQELAGQESFGWVLMKADSGSKGRVSFAARERGTQGPRLVLSVAPAVANTWMNWDGAASEASYFPAGEREHDTLLLGTDRVLWVGAAVHNGWPYEYGHIRLFAVDRETHGLTVIAESSLSALLPEFMANRSYEWNYDSNLFRLADGGVVVVFRNGWGFDSELIFVTLDVDEAQIRVRKDPVVVTTVQLMEPNDKEITFYRSAVARIAEGRFLLSYRGQPEDEDYSHHLHLWNGEPADLSLSGHAAVTPGAVTLTEAGNDSGAAVWEIDLKEGTAVYVWISGNSETGQLPVVIDRAPGFDVIDPLSDRPRRVWDSGIEYSFLAPYSGKAYVKFRAPDLTGASVSIDWAQVYGQAAEHLRLRTIDLSGAVAVLGPANPVPGDGQDGNYLRLRTTHFDKLDHNRVALHVNTAHPRTGLSHALTRILTIGEEEIAMGEWEVVVPSTMGPDYPFSTTVNTDTMAEGLLASVAWDAMDDEPLLGPFSIVGDRVRSTGARLLESTAGNYRNQISYLGNNEYLLAQEMKLGYDPDTGESFYKQHFYVLRTDGQGNILEQAGPFEQQGSLSSPRIEQLDEDHLLVMWHKWHDEYSEESGWTYSTRLWWKILYKH